MNVTPKIEPRMMSRDEWLEAERPIAFTSAADTRNRTNATALRVSVAEDLERALDAGSFRLSACMTDERYRVLCAEVLTDTVGRDRANYGLRDALRIRLRVLHPFKADVARKPFNDRRNNSTGFHAVMQPLERGTEILLAPDVAHGLLFEHGAGLAARERTREGAPLWTLVETGYEWRGVSHDTLTPAMQADAAARERASVTWCEGAEERRLLEIAGAAERKARIIEAAKLAAARAVGA